MNDTETDSTRIYNEISARKPKMGNFPVRNGKLPSKANSLEAQYTCE